mgnify:CR=1 FL=1
MILAMNVIECFELRNAYMSSDFPHLTKQGRKEETNRINKIIESNLEKEKKKTISPKELQQLLKSRLVK